VARRCAINSLVQFFAYGGGGPGVSQQEDLLDAEGTVAIVSRMTLLQLKQEISRLSVRDRRELNAYMIRLRHERPEWKKLISRRMREMDAGRKVSLTELGRRIAARE
jgi:hypothetical protein